MNLSTEQLFTAARTHNGWRDQPVGGDAVRTSVICALGHGDAVELFARSPRLDFDEACRFA